MCARRLTVSAVILLCLCNSPAAYAWQSETPSTPQTPPDISGGTDDLSVDAPLAPLPDLGIDWPDPDVGEVTADQPFAEEEGIRDYAVNLIGLSGVADENAIRAQFKSLSALEQGRDDPANAAQIDRRADEDVALLEDLLRARGYYDAQIETRLSRGGGPVDVTLDVNPGPRYQFADVTIAGVAPDRLDQIRKELGINTGDPVDALTVQRADLAFRAALPRAGYAFAKIGDPDIVVDREAKTATLALSVDTGPPARFGHVRIDGKQLLSARHIERIARFKSGDRYDSARIDDLRRALIATGLAGEVEVREIKAGTAEDGSAIVDLAVRIVPSPLRTIAGTLGYDTGQGARAEISWQHRNLLPPEGAVTFRGVAGTKEQLLAAELRRNNFRERDQILFARIAAQHKDFSAYDARTLFLSASLERQTNLIWQKKWTWAVGAELLASDERDTVASAGVPVRRTFFIAAAPARLSYDGSDDLLDAHRGFRLSGRISPEISLQSGASSYFVSQIDASAYLPLGGGRYVLAGRVRAGSIQGASTATIAPSRRFYAGGGGSVRGFGYQQIGPKDVNGNPIGGRSLTEFALEARIRIGNFGVVPFLDGGQLYTSALPKFTGLRFGAGLGVRYHTSFGPIRVDVGTPLGRRPGESRIGINVSLGQAF